MGVGYLKAVSVQNQNLMAVVVLNWLKLMNLLVLRLEAAPETNSILTESVRL